MPLISIIIPVYNVEAYLCECLDSIVNQCFCNYEVILIDDGSTDDSPNICDKYAMRYPQLTVIHKENGGVSSARNAGLDVAKGDWIWFVDADDWVEKNSLQILNDTVSSHNTDIIFFGLDKVDDNKTWHIDAQDRFGLEKSVFLRTVVCNTHQAIIYRRDIIEKHGIRFPLGMKMDEDLEFQYKYLLHCNYPIQIANTLYNLREREGSASHNPQTIKNSYFGNHMILKHMLEYILLQEDKGFIWMGPRMVMRVKNLMKAAGRLPEVKHSEIQREVRYYVSEFRKIGYKQFDSFTIKLACIDTRLYFFFFTIRKLISQLCKK